jgi:hypothetical protein
MKNILIDDGTFTDNSAVLAALSFLEICANPDEDAYSYRPNGRYVLNGIFPRKKEVIRKAKKCLLPWCPAFTVHNGGYCCAEHCKKHQEQRRAKNVR